MQALSSISTPQTRAMLARSFIQTRATTVYSPNSEIYAQGEKAGTLHHIEFGAVRIYRLLSDGRRQVVAFYVSGEKFGFEAGKYRSFFAESIVSTGLTKVEVEEDGRYSLHLMQQALKEMIRAQQHLLVVGKQSALEKVAVFLVDLAERQGDLDYIDIPMTRTDIGDYLGVTIETVSRSLSRLRTEGLIRLHSSHSIEILQPERLIRLGR